MDAVKGRPFDYANVPVRVHDGRGGFDADDVSGGDETMMSGADEMAFPSRTSELSISFEGEVYVFPAVTPEKAVNDVSSRPNVSRRLASLERFREKRKERSFEKKIRYSCRKEVAQRMHRKNGQFAAVNDTCQTSDDNLGSSNSTPQQEPVCSSRTCQHCGVSENSTPAMRRGPAGPRTLCNACGLMWANKGTLRDLTKGARHLFNQNDLGPLDIKPIAVAAPDKSYFNQDENRTPEQTRLVGEYGNPLLRTEQDLIEITEGIADDSSFGIENSSGNLAEQETLDELANLSGTEFDIPANFDEQVDVDSHIGIKWPVT
ncbi:hypothetical protein MIMGU_mgv1a010280mg [Erythranthe guttata]|uniref:CCT domain-containing protein n=1 Tax=Erythranthe guttata TaxID=4155 RepID=A0A022RFF4_ERYGU|nr:hypothetical protein MIMGU_mgv1a010280mg [Erythranthe guttata]